MLEAITGSLTIIDANLPSRKIYWKGELVENITSVMVHYKEGANNHISITVVDPDYIVPALTSEKKTSLNNIYSNIAASGINLLKKKV